MKRMHKSKALALTRKLVIGSFAPSATAPSVAAEEQLLARRGLWQLLAFLLLSMAAWSAGDRGLFTALPEAFVAWLGTAPPLPLIDLAFAIYLASALILMPGRLSAPRAGSQGWSQLLYRTSFYLLYLASAVLSERFAVVLAGGLFLYGMEQLYFWGIALWGGDENGRGSAEE
ncbi:MAG: hypothetical protein A2091_10595 [Desulfuromonadales bacterium GWD2_61_12]|nr:MAG: hypothetical protein A2005_11840 [Desulfuromonadales bacterium GWC2_61_20]OGR35060.1 MAG: hypothetical protein A2091_10595 [Desulfuromonadales bacterium GWD2_61_12]HBT82337.1 hypothetical protein [Desulfuromonas sp.]